MERGCEEGGNCEYSGGRPEGDPKLARLGEPN